MSAGRGSLLRTVKAVAWSMVGLRKRSAFEEDVQQLNPLHVVLVGLVAVFALVLGLIALVHWVA